MWAENVGLQMLHKHEHVYGMLCWNFFHYKSTRVLPSVYYFSQLTLITAIFYTSQYCYYRPQYNATKVDRQYKYSTLITLIISCTSTLSVTNSESYFHARICHLYASLYSIHELQTRRQWTNLVPKTTELNNRYQMAHMSPATSTTAL